MSGQTLRRGTYVQVEVYGDLLSAVVGAVLGLYKTVRVCKQLGWL